ncbi:MAG: helix-turn-helix domain-containing protein [Bacilli bacterium]
MISDGKLIQYYRKKNGLSQKTLCEGICSITHLSKIENDETKVADETIALFFERLNIVPSEDYLLSEKLEQTLTLFRQMLVANDFKSAKRYKNELVKYSDFPYLYENITYFLINAKYALLTEDYKKFERILKKIPQNDEKITQFQKDYRSHILGIYHIKKLDFTSSHQLLHTIDVQNYSNKEIHYHLAIANYYLGNLVNAYEHALQAKQFFLDQQYFTKLLHTEQLILMLVEDEIVCIDQLKERYDRLIDLAVRLEERKSIQTLNHNLAIQYFKRRRYDLAIEFFETAISTKTKSSPDKQISMLYFLFCWRNLRKPVDARIVALIENAMKNAKEENDEHYYLLTFLYMDYFSAEESTESERCSLVVKHIIPNTIQSAFLDFFVDWLFEVEEKISPDDQVYHLIGLHYLNQRKGRKNR